MSYLFKYVSLRDLRRISDIIFHNRLYAPSYLQMNDPMEAYLNFKPLSDNNSEKEKEKKSRRKVSDLRSRTKLCCLSKANPFTRDGIPMWAHYADGFAGACLILEVDNQEDWQVIEVEYKDDIPKMENNCELSECFRYKMSYWEYEQEVRYFRVFNEQDNNCYFNNIKFVKAILGYKVDNEMMEMIRAIVDRKTNGRRCSYLKRKVSIKDERVYRLTKERTKNIIINGKDEELSSLFE